MLTLGRSDSKLRFSIPCLHHKTTATMQKTLQHTLACLALLFACPAFSQSYSIVVNGPADNCGGSSTYLSITPSGGQSFRWFVYPAYPFGMPISTDPVFYSPTTGYFICEVTDASGPHTTQTVRIRGLNAYITSSNNSTTSCSNTPVVLQEQYSTIYQINVYDTYQWYRNGVLIPGATGWNYQAQTSGTYTLQVGISCGTAFSNPISVTIYSPIPTNTSITANGPLTFCSGSSVTLAVPTVASNYQWKKNGVNITGAVSSTYVANASGNYSCVLTNPCNSITTATVAVTVNPSPTASVSASGPLSFCSGSAVTLSASTGIGYSYQWKNNGNAIPGATASSYVASQSGTYTVEVSAGGCTTQSSGTTVTVNPLPVVTASGLAATYTCQSPPVQLSGSPAGGVFSGPGINGSQFLPSALAVGGPYIITYSATNTTGCTASASQSTSITSGFNCLTPQTLTATILNSTSVTLRWAYSSSNQFQIRYRKTGTTTYSTKTITATACQNSYTLTGLRKNTSYEVSIRSYCTATTASPYSNTVTFTTPAVRMAFESDSPITLFPNPANDILHVKADESWEDQAVSIKIIDLNGRVKQSINTVFQSDLSLDISDLSEGIYVLQLLPDNVSEPVLQRFVAY